MKQKLMCSVLLTILAGHILAQQGFYLKPVFRQHKLSFANYPVDYSIPAASGQTMQFSTIRAKTMIDFDIGLLGGYTFGRMSIETGVLRDWAGEGIVFKCLALNQPDSSFRNTTGVSDYSGSGYLRYPLRFYYRLNERENFLHWGERCKNAILFVSWSRYCYPSIWRI
jgi:hypothetical protein